MGYLKSFLAEVEESMGPIGEDISLRVPMSFVIEVSKALGLDGYVTSNTISVAHRMTEYLSDLSRDQLYADDPVFAGMCQSLEREVIDDDKIAVPALLPAKPYSLTRYTIRRDKKNPMSKWKRPRSKYKAPLPPMKPSRRIKTRKPNSLLSKGDQA